MQAIGKTIEREMESTNTKLMTLHAPGAEVVVYQPAMRDAALLGTRTTLLLAEKPGQPSTPRLAVRTTLDLGQISNIAQKLVETATSLGQKLKAAFRQHLASLSDESQRLAAELHSQASLVSEAAVRQRNCHPEVQTALLAHCKDHLGSMQMLAARPDATLETLAALASSPDPKTRLNVASNIGNRMKICNTPEVEAPKNTVFDALIQGYVSDYAPHLVPVCKSPQQLSEMFGKTSKTLGALEVFVENPCTPDNVLLEMASSQAIHLVQHDVARQAKQILQKRTELREVQEASSTFDDMAPS